MSFYHILRNGDAFINILLANLIYTERKDRVKDDLVKSY